MTPAQTIKNYQTRLDFTPLEAWSDKLPAYAWNHILLCGFHLDAAHPVFDLAVLNPNLAGAIHAVYPELSFVELVWIRHSLKTIANEETWAFFNLYGYRDSDDLVQTCELILQLPRSLQNFSAEKGITLREFAPLKAAGKNLPALAALWSGVIETRASRQHAIKILEILVDLFHHAHDLSAQENESAEAWLKRLMSLRYPQTHARDLLASQALKKINWPLKTQAQFERHGDATFINVNVRGMTAQDLKNRVAQLSSILNESTEEMERSWNPSSETK